MISSMLFNSFVFIFAFLPIVFVGYYALNRYKNSNLAMLWLAAGSLFFYGYFVPKYLILLAISILFNYGMGELIRRTSNRKWKLLNLIIGLAFNIGLLGYYKYADFFITNFNAAFSTDYNLMHLILPLGLSFITFQKIAYLVDVYQGEETDYQFTHFALFATFFPQLIAGPIVHHKEIIPQFEDERNRHIQWDNISKGIFIFVIGLAKKVVIADSVAVWANDGYANVANLDFIGAWITSLSYTVQLYFDFSGYCDMAIGLALLFNIRLPINFNSPYKARNIQDFWKRWHMTLGRFLTQYIYIPLGGSKHGEWLTYLNTLIVFFISGFWHGAGWTFIIWGLMHGVGVVAVRVWKLTKIRLPYVVAWLLTFQFVNIGWVFFRSASVEQAFTILGKMFTPDWASVPKYFKQAVPYLNEAATLELFIGTMDNPYIIVASLVFLFAIALSMRNSLERLDRFAFNWRSIFFIQVLVLLVLTSVFFMQKNSVFLYFNF